MPRLLLVDDNPSIHKIAENLLATTSIELVCVDSAAAALQRINEGERFDVALVDTSMNGMDGWALLAKLRELPATAKMPIAMMAGVLDTVDPEQLKAAPIQGFLKKPVELRELGDRVTKLMETPVQSPAGTSGRNLEPPLPPRPASPFATMPAVRIDQLPEFRRKPEVAEALPSDLLELTEEDLYPESLPESPEEPVAEEALDLEELDIASLRTLSMDEPAPSFSPMDEHSKPTPERVSFASDQLDAIDTLDRLPSSVVDLAPNRGRMGSVLPDMGPTQEDPLALSSMNPFSDLEEITAHKPGTEKQIPLANLMEDVSEEGVFTPPLPPLEESLDWSDESESMLSIMDVTSQVPGAPMGATVPEEELDLLDVSIPESPAVKPASPFSPQAVHTEAIVESAMLETASTPIEAPTAAFDAPQAPQASTLSSKELLDAMKADPALMDSLTKAVVARLGDQVLREIAWEVIPELAERFPRN